MDWMPLLKAHAPEASLWMPSRLTGGLARTDGRCTRILKQIAMMNHHIGPHRSPQLAKPTLMPPPPGAPLWPQAGRVRRRVADHPRSRLHLKLALLHPRLEAAPGLQRIRKTRQA